MLYALFSRRLISFVLTPLILTTGLYSLNWVKSFVSNLSFKSSYVFVPGKGVSTQNWAVKELINTYQNMGMDPEIWPRTATSIAVNLFTENLGLPWIGTCPGIAGNHHAANEYLNIDSYHKSIKFMSYLIYNLGK